MEKQTLNVEALMAVEQELQRAATDPKLRKRWERLEERRITPETEIAPMEFLFELFCKPCFPRGELVAMTGKAKSGKTFFSSILMALCFRKEILGMKRLQAAPLHVMWVDTEQSEESTQDILVNRVLRLVRGHTESTESAERAIPAGMMDVFNLRGVFWQERLSLVEAAIGKFQPDLVILDGIRDLIDDINDGVKSQNVLERLMHIASSRHCCIVCILHQNKAVDDRSMRGWMGTELSNKTFETYECSKQDGVFSVKQADTRKYEIADKLQFTIGEEGLPRPLTRREIEEGASTNAPSAESVVRPPFNEKYVLERKEKFVIFKLKELFTDALEGKVEMDDLSLRNGVMELARITSPNLYYSVLRKAVKEGVITQRLDDYNRTSYMLA